MECCAAPRLEASRFWRWIPTANAVGSTRSPLARLLPYAVILLFAAAADAQDPFAPQPGGAAPPAPAGQDPFGGPATARPAAPKKPAALPAEQVPLVLQQLRDSDPKTPETILRAAYAVLQYGRPDECKTYLTKFLDAKFADSELATVPHKVGSDLLMHLAREEKIQPEGKEVARLVQDAAYKKVTDPAEIEKTISLLSNPSLSIRQTALAKLAESGSHVVTPMLHVLADPSRESEHRFIRVALAHLATSTEAPLVGALDVQDEKLRAQIVAVLGRIRSKLATMHLVRPAVDPASSPELHEVAAASLAKIVGSVPDAYEAERYLTKEIESLLSGRLPYQSDPEGLVEMWFWNDSERAVQSRKLATGDAALLLASRLAADLAALEPQSDAARRMQLLTSLELAKVLGGLDRPLAEGDGAAAGPGGNAFAAADPETMSAVLAEAIKRGRVPAIVAAAEVLGQRGDASVLTTGSAAESPLAQALTYPDRRARLTAALAIAQLSPKVAFPGASRALEPLAEAIRTAGVSRVLIGHPRGEEAQTLVGYMNKLGFEGEAAYTGRRVAELATRGADLELLLISDAIDAPPVKDLVQWLRRDYRTAHLPIGVMAQGENLDELRYAFEDDKYTLVFPRLYSTEVARNEIDKVAALAGRNRIGPEERIARAKAALAALDRLTQSHEGHSVWNILRDEGSIVMALDNAALSAAAAAVLGKLGTPKSQTALVDFASQNTRPLADRQAASAAFAASVQSHGLNLTQRQIATQFDRYNASERLDPQTQAVLGSILDAIEAPTAESNKVISKNE
jgi:hypothetical protein